MSLWGATVITNLLSAIPFFGQDLVELIWGQFSIGNATLNRFFSLHYLLPFIISLLAMMHLIALHGHGSSNPLGITGNLDRLAMQPYYIFKDIITILLALIIILSIVFFAPNVLNHSDNYIEANPMVTPISIVPEWYLLPFYAILRSIPNKLLGVIAMFASLLILLTLPIFDLSKVKGNAFKPLSKIIYWIFISNFILLMFLGSQHVEVPFVFLGQLSTTVYFMYFILLVPIVSIMENTLMDLINE